MHAKDSIRQAYKISHMVLTAYVNDMTDENLLVRSVPGCNHVAWQLGHLISSANGMLEGVGAQTIELPEGFADKHNKETAGNDNAADFYSKAQYLQLLEQIKEATFAGLEQASDESLDDDAPEYLQSIAKTVGDVYVLIACHPLMHAGQLVPLRRHLELPVVM